MDETAAGEVVPMRRPGASEMPVENPTVPAGSAAERPVDAPVGTSTVAETLTALDVVDVLIGLVTVSVVRSQRLADRVRGAARPLAPLARPVQALGERLLGGDRVQNMLGLGRAQRLEAGRRTELAARRLAPQVVDDALGLVDVTSIVRNHVDLDAVAAGLDVDAVVARADIEAVLDRVDIDAVAARIDIEAILDRVDIDGVAARVDIEAILDRVDIDGVAARVDIEAILDRVDIDEVATRLDLDAVAARLDLDAVVARLDLIALAEYVVEGIDLPGIIQSSTGAMASESLREVRWQGVSADERVAHVVDRMLRRKPRAPGAALPSDPSDRSNGTPPSVPPVLPGPA